MKRCECGQYPDVCARYGHREDLGAKYFDMVTAERTLTPEDEDKIYDLLMKPRYQMKTPPYWASEEHAMLAGMLIGHLMAKGVVCAPSVDAEGNYMNEIMINMEPGLDSMRVKVEVLPF